MAWGGVTVVRNFFRHEGGVKGIRDMCQLMERCDGHGGEERCVGRCDSFQEV